MAATALADNFDRTLEKFEMYVFFLDGPDESKIVARPKMSNSDGFQLWLRFAQSIPGKKNQNHFNQTNHNYLHILKKSSCFFFSIVLAHIWFD